MSGSEYLLWSYGQFEKMTFNPPDPLTTRLCCLSSRRPGVVLSFQLVVALPLVILSLRRLLVFSSSCRASWLMHHLSSSSHCAALLSFCHASWLSHCLSSSSRCATLLSTCCVSLLLHRLSLSSCCAPRRPLILLSRWLVVTLPLDALPSRRLIVHRCHLPRLPPPPQPPPPALSTASLSYIDEERGSSITTTSEPMAAPS